MWTNVCPSFLKLFEIGFCHLHTCNWILYFLITDKMKDSKTLSLMFASSVHFSISYQNLVQGSHPTPLLPSLSSIFLFLLFFTISPKFTNYQPFSNKCHLYLSIFTQTTQRISLYHSLYIHIFHFLLCFHIPLTLGHQWFHIGKSNDIFGPLFTLDNVSNFTSQTYLST